MKKTILYISIILLLISPTYLWADECSQSCKIADAPAPALTEYITNLESIKSNVLSALADAEPDSKKASNMSMLSAFNALLSFVDYFSHFDFKVSLPITNEVPKEVTRDHRKLEGETEKFTQILKSAEKRGTSRVKVEDVCSGVSNCNIPDGYARDVLVAIINNNRNITRLYETSILDKAFLTENRDFSLVSDDFESQIETYYNKDTLGACSKCEGNTWSNISEKIKNISFKNSDYKDGMQTWKDAWALMRGGKAEGGQERRQAELLNEYLGKQGISGSQADVVLDNFDKYGTGGLSASNPLFNSAKYEQAAVKNEADTFAETIQEQFEGEEKVPLVVITKVDTKIKETEDLQKEIKTIYEDQIPFAKGQDVETQKLQLRILNMHFSLIRSINMLQKNKKGAEKVCDKQGTGMGKCSYDL